MAQTRSAVLVRLTPDLKERLIAMAKRERRSLSKQVEFLLEMCLDVQDRADLTKKNRSR